MNVEEWRPVEGWPYEVSDRGRVRNAVARVRTHLGRILRPSDGSGGYLVVKLKDAPRRRFARIHIVVAEAFHGSRPTPKHEVNHKDGDKRHNAASNLEWVTRSENQRHAFRIGLNHNYGRAKGTRLTLGDLAEAKRLVDGGGRYRDVAPRFGVSAGYLCNLLRKKYVPAGLEGATVTTRSHVSRLGPEGVRLAREMAESGSTMRQIGDALEMSAAQVCRILNGQVKSAVEA